MVSHFQVRWHHDDPDDPVRIYEELSDERYELRKVEEFAAQEEFTVEPLTADAFESVWSRASDPPT